MEALATLIDNPSFTCVQDLVQRGDQKLTKQLLLVARHNGIAEGSGNFAALTEYVTGYLLDLPCFHPERATSSSLEFLVDPIPRIQAFFQHPLYSAGIIMSCFLAPLTDEQIRRTRLESYLKEILVMDSENISPKFDYTPFFGKPFSPIHTDILVNPKAAQHVGDTIDMWINQLQQNTCYLKMSKKLLPTRTREELRGFCDDLLEDPTTATQASLEWMYIKKGLSFSGGCELKQRWYTNGVSPRSYFVAGPDAYNRSKYTKDAWNLLVDLLPSTNRRNRVNPTRIHVTGMKTAIFYDLTSFTSNMSEQRHFLDALAIYCHGRIITVMDSILGPIPYDLGQLIKEYNELNFYPEYNWTDDPSLLPEVHGVAGFLGVYGNIATCTFLHGAILLQLTDQDYECGCAGDDAVVCIEDEDRVWTCVSLIGILAVEKTYNLLDGDVVYLKRRTWLDRRSFCLRSRALLQLPSFLWGMSKESLSRFRESSMDKRELVDLAAKSLQALYRSAPSFYRQEQYFSDILRFTKAYYIRLGFPLEGNIPQLTSSRGPHRQRFIPSLEALGSKDFIGDTIHSVYDGIVVLPDREEGYSAPLKLHSGTLFESKGGRYLSFLIRLGLVEVVGKRKTVYTGADGLERLLGEWERPERAWIKYRVKHHIPNLWGNFGIVEGIYTHEVLFGDNDMGTLSVSRVVWIYLLRYTKHLVCEYTRSILTFFPQDESSSDVDE
jgi:hypothetical protein